MMPYSQLAACVELALRHSEGACAVSRRGWKASRRCVLALLVVWLLIVNSGCGSSDDGVAAKSPSAILAVATAATLHASSVHISINRTQRSLTSKLELEILADQSGRGTSSVGRLLTEMVALKGDVYVRGNRTYEDELLGSRGIAVPAHRWLKLPPKDSVDYLRLLTQPELRSLLEPRGPLTKGASTTIDGHDAVELEQTGTRLYTSRIYIAATGTPYPLEIVLTGPEHGQITFTRWNESVSLSPPAKAVEVSRLERRGA